MLSYNGLYMPNTVSAIKAVRQSERKRQNNLIWKGRIKSASKALLKSIKSKADSKVLVEQFSALQKVLDKSAKNNVIHKNKASRLKSRFAAKISTQK